ncbi:HRDC domain-containing protein [Mucilaginibacter calamicampi]|uniref:HRDC domain-containing protein n=1 Tax=Mucilaginibacter calamicampi TaxID=1302352 RepID=A0ABW2YWL3_9SPHI
MNTLTPQMQLVMDYVETTNTVVFLTGKAGTGKTTLLQHIRQYTRKKTVIVAPTGVAAINAGGMTIHSFFQLPFGPLIPGGSAQAARSYSEEKLELLANLELLVIDEVSMVRPDVLDQIDLVLRTVKTNNYPFGGVQLLLIGDLSQLSPIIRDEEWVMLSRYYNTPYFFSSLILKKTPFVRIELNVVFRQKEQTFVDILNEVRDQRLSTENLTLLNERFIPDFIPATDEPYITLTTHNSIVQQVNSEFLAALPGTEQEFKATIRGEFPKDAYPTETGLKLKIGAQVMFVKNDGSAEKKYYNGKIGTVERLDTDTVHVRCGESEEIMVQAVEWTNVKYALKDEEISETNAGSFAQIPLKLAWAITIHKSQGLSFDRAIVDVSEAFTHGQAYVALSRCRTLSGLILRNPVTADNIIGDPAVSLFNEQAGQTEPDAASLLTAQDNYRLFLLSELFDLKPLENKVKGFESLAPGIEKDLLQVSEKFIRQLKPERSKDASAYFLEKLTRTIESLHLQLPLLVGTSKELAGKADKLISWLMTRAAMMKHFTVAEFNNQDYLDLKARGKVKPDISYIKLLDAKPNQELFDDIMLWRERQAKKENIMPNMILTEKTAATVAEKLPVTLKALSAIKGIGPLKTTQYGPVIIQLIRDYQQKLTGITAQNNLF